jgi:hypothetical protein
MAIIRAGDVPIDENFVDGTELSRRLERLYAAFHSQNSNESRPPAITAGGLWSKTITGGFDLMLFDGTDDVKIGSVFNGQVSVGLRGEQLATVFSSSTAYKKGDITWNPAENGFEMANKDIVPGLPQNGNEWEESPNIINDAINVEENARIAGDNALYALDATNVKLTGAQSIAGSKTFTERIIANAGVNSVGGYYTTASQSLAMYEMHLPGNVASAMHLTTDGLLRFSSTNGAGSAAATRFSIDGSGNSTASGNLTAYSDETLKRNWQDLPDDLVDQLANLLAGTYERIDTGNTQIGVGAQSLQKFMPAAVSEGADGILSVSYGNAALAACVALAKRVVALEEKINASSQ